jgi:hypothetical protein
MAQVASCRPLTTGTWVRAWASPCGICGGQSGNGTGFSLSFLVFPINIMTLWLPTLTYHLGDEQ